MAKTFPEKVSPVGPPNNDKIPTPKKPQPQPSFGRP